MSHNNLKGLCEMGVPRKRDIDNEIFEYSEQLGKLSRIKEALDDFWDRFGDDSSDASMITYGRICAKIAKINKIIDGLISSNVPKNRT